MPTQDQHARVPALLADDQAMIRSGFGLVLECHLYPRLRHNATTAVTASTVAIYATAGPLALRTQRLDNELAKA